MFKEIHIYDLDGTLIDSTHRYRIDPKTGKIDLAHWIENDVPEKIALDKLLPLAEQYKKQIADPSIYVCIATARVMKKADFDFLKTHLGLPNKIVHRKGRNDNRKGAALKIAGLHFLNNLSWAKKIVTRFFYEDNKDYLYPVAEALNAVPVYVESKQGF